MCGLVGAFDPLATLSADVPRSVTAMRELVVHRGPDDAGLFVSPHCCLGFRRLSIIDPAAGHQPMTSARRPLTVVLNGEIYNFRELRRQLEGEGCQFRSQSDTEVLLAGYEHWGEQVVSHLRGIFAFAIHDAQNNKLFAARDHVGVKPFLYTYTNGTLVFASEIKALLQWPGVTARLRTSLIPRYMSFLWVPAPDTMFEGIGALEPGHCLRLDHEGLSTFRFWHPQLTQQDERLSDREAIELVDSELRRVVREQLVSDVPLGAFLSGGVDSSAIVAYMNQVVEGPITTYTTGFEKAALADDVILSDLEYARIAAAALNVDHHELILSPAVVDLLPKLVYHMDQPVADPAAITTYLICKAAKERCTVMLSGVGGDEIFGGYPRYLATILAERYQALPAAIRSHVVKPLLRSLPTGSNRFLRNAKKFLGSADLSFQQRYFGYLTYYSQAELASLLVDPFDWEGIFEHHRNMLDAYRSPSSLQTMMNLDLMTFLPSLNLEYTDRMSNAASVEVRVPFLDHLLIETAARLPDRHKVRFGVRKYLLKKTVERYLPRQVVWRKKAGFGAPIGAWLRGQAREMMLDLLSDETIARRGIFRRQRVRQLIDDHLQGREYRANQLWQLITLELWLREFVDGAGGVT